MSIFAYARITPLYLTLVCVCTLHVRIYNIYRYVCGNSAFVLEYVCTFFSSQLQEYRTKVSSACALGALLIRSNYLLQEIAVAYACERLSQAVGTCILP